MSFYNKTKITVVLYAVIAFLLAVLVTGNYFAISYRGLVSQFFGQKTYELVETGEEGEQDTNYYPSAYTDIYDLIEDETAYAKRVQGEGVVLLQNSGLPLSGNETVTLLGKYSKDDCFRNSGSGSGNADTSRAGTIREGFASAGFALNMDMLAYYDGVSTTAEEPAADTLPAFDSEVGVVFISRGGAEGLDVDIEALTLTDTEKGIIDASLANCDETVVLLNTFNPVECGYLEGKDLSVMWIGAAGELGIGVVPQVLKGDINPSGKLVDTYAYDLTSSPAMRNQGDFTLTNVTETTGNKYVNYAESIYYGYRYYETRYADAVTDRANVGNYEYGEQVQYPFGYGLSYTSFEYSGFGIEENGDEIMLSVTVTNTGRVAGKEAVEFYMQSPYTQYDIDHGIEKSAAELVGFDKTAELAPGDSEEISVTVPKEYMKAYDYESGYYIVDEGDYWFAAGANVHDALNNILAAQGYGVADGMTEEGTAVLAGSIHSEFDDTTYRYSAETGNPITNQFEDADLRYYMPDTVYLTRSDWEGTYPEQAADMQATQQMIDDVLYDEVDVAELTEDPDAVMPTTGAQNGLTLAMLIGKEYNDEAWSDLLDQMNAQELMDLFAVGGYMTIAVESVSKPASIDQDGPASLKASVMGGVNLFAYPSEMLLASTWDVDLVGEMGSYIGEDGLMSGVTGWYAPGINIHRTPNGGRNFEYYSEDPLQTGLYATAVTKAAQAKGMVVYVKHLFLNEQETNRSVVCTFATEQAIRDIYLRPFEMTLVDGEARGVMNSMNRIGMVWAGAHGGMQIDVLRGEWGSHAITITDATLSQSNKMRPLPSLLGGSDLFLCTNYGVFEIEDFASSPTVMSALRDAAHRILYNFANSNVMNGLSASMRVVPIMPAWQITLIVVDCVLAVAAVVGVALLTRWLVRGNKQNHKEA